MFKFAYFFTSVSYSTCLWLLSVQVLQYISTRIYRRGLLWALNWSIFIKHPKECLVFGNCATKNSCYSHHYYYKNLHQRPPRMWYTGRETNSQPCCKSQGLSPFSTSITPKRGHFCLSIINPLLPISLSKPLMQNISRVREGKFGPFKSSFWGHFSIQ